MTDSILDKLAVIKTCTDTESSSSSQWMLSFADLLSLMVTFFVLIFSFGFPYYRISDYEKERETTVSVQKADVESNVKLSRTDENLSTNYLLSVISGKLKNDPQLRSFSAEYRGEKIIISLDEDKWNDSLALKITQILKAISNDIRIYTGELDRSYSIIEQMKKHKLTKKIDFFEDTQLTGKIDIVIHP